MCPLTVSTVSGAATPSSRAADIVTAFITEPGSKTSWIAGLPIARGRGFRENEANTAARVIVIGASIVDILFPNEEPLGKRVRLGRLELEVIGTIERQGSGPFGGNGDQVAAIPIGLFMELYGTGRSINITVMGKPGEDIHRLQDRAIVAFRQIRGLDAQQEDDFFIFSNDSMREIFDQPSRVVAQATPWPTASSS